MICSNLKATKEEETVCVKFISLWRDKCEMYGYDSHFNTFYIFSSVLSSPIIIILANLIIVKFKFSSFCLWGPIRTPVDHSWTPFVSHIYRQQTAHITLQNTFIIQYSVTMFIWAAWQFDSVQLHSGPVYHKEVTFFIMRCVWGGKGRKRMWNKVSEKTEGVVNK